MDPQIRKLMYHEISVEKFEGYTGEGVPQYEDPEFVPCHVTGETRMIRNSEGEVLISTIAVYVSGTSDPGIRTTDRITLPDGRQPPIIGLNRFYDEYGRFTTLEVTL